jgi:hypothetical protein
MGVLGCCAVAAAVLAALVGSLFSGLLVDLGAFQWIDSWDPAGRGLRWRGESPPPLSPPPLSPPPRAGERKLYRVLTPRPRALGPAGETPWLVPKPWLFTAEDIPQVRKTLGCL